MKTPKTKVSNAKAIAVSPKKTPSKMSTKQSASAKIPAKMKMGGSKKAC